jgi:hypothetical protein
LEPDAAASLTGFSEQIGGWMESKYFSGFYSIDPEPPIDETQPFKALQIASLSYYEDVWENTAEWRPAVAVYHDRSNGKVVIRRDGGCGYGAQGEEGFEHVRSSLGEFLRAYTSYWESGSSRPFNFYSIEW